MFQDKTLCLEGRNYDVNDNIFYKLVNVYSGSVILCELFINIDIVNLVFIVDFVHCLQVASLQMKIVSEDRAVEARTVELLAEWEKEKPVEVKNPSEKPMS